MRVRLCLALTGTILSVLGASAVPASSDTHDATKISAQSGALDVGRYSDYLATGTSPAGKSVAAGGIGADQCNQVLAARVGQWFCPEQSIDASPNGAAIAASTGFCNTGGCYTRYNDFQADYSANSGTWGYGSTVLGRETHSVDWSLTGAQNISKPVQYINSVTTKNVVFTGDLLYGTNGTPGTQISGKMGLYLAGAVAGGTPRYWDPNGYKSYDTSRTCHIVVHQFSWEYGSYSGYWYSYVKSIVHCQNGDGIYRFHAVTGLPSSPYGGGYNP